MLLAERFEPGGEVHRVSMHRITLPAAAADIAGHQRARIDPDAHPDALSGELTCRNGSENRPGSAEGAFCRTAARYQRDFCPS